MNAALFVGLGFYILTALRRGNGAALGKAIEQEGGFIKWAIAIAILSELYKNGDMGHNPKIVQALVGVAGVYIVLKILSDPAIIQSIKGAWNMLPDSNFTKGN